MFRFDISEHINEINLGIDLGYSQTWGFVRFSISILTHTYNFGLDWKPKNV